MNPQNVKSTFSFRMSPTAIRTVSSIIPVLALLLCAVGAVQAASCGGDPSTCNYIRVHQAMLNQPQVASNGNQYVLDYILVHENMAAFAQITPCPEPYICNYIRVHNQAELQPGLANQGQSR